MVPVNSSQAPVAVDLDIIQNRVAVALAKRERLIKSWTASSSRPRPTPKTQEELDAEDAELFRIEPPHLGLGAPIPKEFLNGDATRKDISSNEKLRHLIMGKKGGIQASKARGTQDKFGSARRSLKGESSDEEEGRSGLGRAKKVKTGHEPLVRDTPAKFEARLEVKQDIKQRIKQTVTQQIKQEVKDAKPEFKQETKQEAKQEVKQEATREADGRTDLREKIESNHVTQESFKERLLKQKPVVLQAPKKQTFIPKKPLVDYSSSEEDNKAHLDIESMKPPAKLNLPLAGPSSTSSSKISSTESASDDSEPSDMETIIPQGLTPDVLPSTSIPSLGVDDAKRDRRRQKKARKRERERQQRKAMAAGLSNSGVEKPGSAPAPLGGHGLKLKDKLRDANGN
jgi:Protein of unknown function (DUF3245)